MSMRCIYVVANVSDPGNTLNQLCFDEDSDAVINVTTLDSESSSDMFSSNISTAVDADYLWVLFAGCMVFFMQCGFTMLEAGAVKNINVQNILFKNLMDACIGAFVFFFFGYTIAYGIPDSSDGFMGTGNPALAESEDWNAFFFQWTFAATAATIVSGSVAGRCSLLAYGLYTVTLTTWVYPVVVHWIWDGQGWLSAFNDDISLIDGGLIDFAGSGVVHMVGGWSGLCGAYFLGPRIGRFDEKEEQKQRLARSMSLAHEHKIGNNVGYQVLGMFILWFGWYGFNCGSTLATVGAMELASKVAVNTTLAAGAGGVTAAVLGVLIDGYWHVPTVINGILGGLVSITAPCPVVDPGSSAAIGLLGGVFCFGASQFLQRVQVDDPLDAWAVHGVCGIWGVLSVAFFSTPENIAFAGYNDTLVGLSRGELFSNQLLGVVMIIIWVCGFIGGLFAFLNKLKILRVDQETEARGLDAAEHGGNAMNMPALVPNASNTGTGASLGVHLEQQEPQDDGPAGDETGTLGVPQKTETPLERVNSRESDGDDVIVTSDQGDATPSADA